VSTEGQDLRSQDFVVDEWLAKRGITDVIRFTDKLSGKRDDRPGLHSMCEAIERGEVDTIVVFRLDRISRRSVTALRLLLDWLNRGVAFYAVDQPALHLGVENPLRLTIAAIFSDLAELERQAIVSRVKAGLAAAKARGVRLGALPKVTQEQATKIRELRAAGITCRAVAKQMGLSSSTVSRVEHR
jgi:DNA invertase Pin-like site-specific DNA recombinase